MTPPKPRPAISQADYQRLSQFRYLIRRFLEFSQVQANEAGLTPRQHQALLAIKGFPGGGPVAVGDLAERLLIRHHSAVELVNRLEAHGFLHRARNRDDRREVLLHLTTRGKRILRDLALPHREELRSAGFAILNALKKALGGREMYHSRGETPGSQNLKRARSAARISFKKR